jgi:hypothetical protein
VDSDKVPEGGTSTHILHLAGYSTSADILNLKKTFVSALASSHRDSFMRFLTSGHFKLKSATRRDIHNYSQAGVNETGADSLKNV